MAASPNVQMSYDICFVSLLLIEKDKYFLWKSFSKGIALQLPFIVIYATFVTAKPRLQHVFLLTYHTNCLLDRLKGKTHKFTQSTFDLCHVHLHNSLHYRSR